MNSGNFTIEIDPPAAKELKNLTHTKREIIEHLIKAIDSLAFHPFQGKPLKGNKKGCYSLRYHAYRVIYEIYLSQKIIHIIRVGHRRDVYR